MMPPNVLSSSALPPLAIAVFDTHDYDRAAWLATVLPAHYHVRYINERLSPETCHYAHDCRVVCGFVNDDLSAKTFTRLAAQGVQLLTLRCAGYNHVDLVAARAAGIRVMRVPAYSPPAIAEQAFALLLALQRRLPEALTRTRQGDFHLDGLVGHTLAGKTFGVIGTGNIGTAALHIAAGFGCQLLAHDLAPNPKLRELGCHYVSLEALLRRSDVISLHLPLTPDTENLINAQRLAWLRPQAILLNTARGGIVDTVALLDALDNNQLAGAGLDVYAHEAGVFFPPSGGANVTPDPLLQRLLQHPRVLLTAHQAFLTTEALGSITRTTLANIADWQANRLTCHPNLLA